MSAHNITIKDSPSVRLPTAGKYCDRDIIVTVAPVERADTTINAWYDEEYDRIEIFAENKQGKGYVNVDTSKNIERAYANLSINGKTAKVRVGNAEMTKDVQTATMPKPELSINTTTGILLATVSMGGNDGYLEGNAAERATYDVGAKIDPSIIKKGEKLFGQTGTYEGDTSIKTCTVNIKFFIAPSSGYFTIAANRFDTNNGNEYFGFTDVFNTGTYTISNVVCGSNLFIQIGEMSSLYGWPDLRYEHDMGAMYCLRVPKTEGTYSATIDAFED